MIDKLKLGVAALISIVGLVGFYLLGNQPTVFRVLSVLVGFGLGIAVALQSEPGKRFKDFVQDSIKEAKKVVWPSRQETMQWTALVFVFVVIMSIFLWLTDKSLEWLLYHVVLGWR